MKRFYLKALAILAGVLMLAACKGPQTEPGPGDYHQPGYSSRFVIYNYDFYNRMPAGNYTVYVYRTPISHGLDDYENLSGWVASGSAEVSSSVSLSGQAPFDLHGQNGQSFYESGVFHVLVVNHDGSLYPLNYFNNVNFSQSGYSSAQWNTAVNSMAVRLTGTADLTVNGEKPSGVVTVSAFRSISNDNSNSISSFRIENYSDANKNWSIFIPPEYAVRGADLYMNVETNFVKYNTGILKLSPANLGKTVNVDPLVLNENSVTISGKVDINVNGARAVFTEVGINVAGYAVRTMLIDYSTNPEGEFSFSLPPASGIISVPLSVRVDSKENSSTAYGYPEGLLKEAIVIQIEPGSTDAITIDPVVMDIDAVTVSGTTPFINNNNTPMLFAYDEYGQRLFSRVVQSRNNDGTAFSSYIWSAWVEAPESPVIPYFSIENNVNNGRNTKLIYPGTEIKPDDTNVTIDLGQIDWSTGGLDVGITTDPLSMIKTIDAAVSFSPGNNREISKSSNYDYDFEAQVSLPYEYSWSADWYVDGELKGTTTPTNTYKNINAADYDVGNHHVTIFITANDPAVTVTRAFSFTVTE